ncbi:DUF3276 family protein [Emticicia sp. SJ17W-69]|uniref:DUF3276 family protein n=1 Tax=Emticicia sp. SJ17W-69 TaxID=3421657 RepID=UPI003EBDCD64
MEREDRDKIYSKRVRAGKRTYFFDVRSTRSSDYYLTITESRRFQKDGGFVFEKSKMFIYKEDFNKFLEALQETVDHIKTELMPDYDFDQFKHDDQFANGESVDSSDTTVIEDYASSGSDLKWE